MISLAKVLIFLMFAQSYNPGMHTFAPSGSVSCAAGPTPIQTAAGCGGGIGVCVWTFTNPVTAGNWVLVHCHSTTGTLSAPADNKGNSYSIITGNSGGSGFTDTTTSISKTTTGGASFTMTATDQMFVSECGSWEFAAAAWSALDIPPSIPTPTFANTAVTTFALPAVTTTVSADILISITTGLGSTPSPPAGWNNTGLVGSGGVNLATCLADAPGVYAGNWTSLGPSNASNGWTVNQVKWKP